MCDLDSEDAIYKELWHACAGPLVNVPRQGELVFYFPQGHIEQVARAIMLVFIIFFHTIKYKYIYIYIYLIINGGFFLD